MKLNKEGRKLARELLRSSFTNGVLDTDKIRKAGDVVVAAKPRNAVGVLKEYTHLIRLELAKRHAVVESSTALEAGEKNNISSTLKSKYGADVTTEFTVNPELLGGLRIQIGSTVVDASVRTRLDRLAVDLAS